MKVRVAARRQANRRAGEARPGGAARAQALQSALDSGEGAKAQSLAGTPIAACLLPT